MKLSIVNFSVILIYYLHNSQARLFFSECHLCSAVFLKVGKLVEFY